MDLQKIKRPDPQLKINRIWVQLSEPKKINKLKFYFLQKQIYQAQSRPEEKDGFGSFLYSRRAFDPDSEKKKRSIIRYTGSCFVSYLSFAD